MRYDLCAVMQYSTDSCSSSSSSNIAASAA